MTTWNNAETWMIFPIFSGDTNHYHTLFGGTAMTWIDQAAFGCATRRYRRKGVTVHIGKVNFHYPVRKGSIVELVACLVRTGRSSMYSTVDLRWEPMNRDDCVLACQTECVLVALNENAQAVALPPLTPDSASSRVKAAHYA